MNLRKSVAVMILPICIVLCCLTGCSKTVNETDSSKTVREITDMAGRRVTIPKEIQKVYSTGQPGVVMLYTLCPDKLLGWDLQLSDKEAEYINAKYLSLPVLGLMQGGNNTANKEEIMERGPDFILLMTSIDESSINTADELHNTMGIPVVMADYNLESLSKTYDFLGDILDEAKRAKTLSRYCSDTITKVKEIASGIKQEDILKVYYAQGSNGLQTAPKGSSHSEVIDLVGGDNVVELEAESDGRLTINMEQLLLYNPDVIIASYSMGDNKVGEGDISAIMNSSKEWKLLDAVKSAGFYSTPCFPYNWLDMPPSVNRIIGIKWLANLLYPNYFKYNIREETKEFYSLFYQKELSKDELNSLLQGAIKN